MVILNLQTLNPLQFLADSFLPGKDSFVSCTQCRIHFIDFFQPQIYGSAKFIPSILVGRQSGFHFRYFRLKPLQIIGKQDNSIVAFFFISYFNRNYPFLNFGTEIIYRIQRVDEIVVLFFFFFNFR